MGRKKQKEAWDIIDQASGKARVLDEKCSTCIFHPGNRMHLSPGRLKEVVEGNLRASALLTCHKTLPYNGYGVDPAACNGFWTSYGLQTAAGRFAKFVLGILWIKPPEGEEYEQHPPSDGEAADRRESEEAPGGAEAGE